MTSFSSLDFHNEVLKQAMIVYWNTLFEEKWKEEFNFSNLLMKKQSLMEDDDEDHVFLEKLVREKNEYIKERNRWNKKSKPTCDTYTLYNQEPNSYECEFPSGEKVSSKIPAIYKQIELKEEAEDIIMVHFATFISDKYKWFWEFPPEAYDILPKSLLKKNQYNTYNLSTERALRGLKPEPRQNYRLHLKNIGGKLNCRVFELYDDAWLNG